MNAVQKAEDAIAAILRDLERETGALVERVEIESIDVSTIEVYRWIRKIEITLRPVPGTQWSTTKGD